MPDLILLGPPIALLGLAIARALPRPWRTTIGGGSALTGTLVLVFPVLAPPATDHARRSDLLTIVAVLWWLLLSATVSRIARDRRRGRTETDPPSPPQDPRC